MTTFANAIKNQSARTANGMKANASSGSGTVDLFYKIGAMRGKDVIPAFIAAYDENREHALRIAQWARDARQGAGERKIFRDIVKWLILTGRVEDATILLAKVPELGRWDDMLFLYEVGLDIPYVTERYITALRAGDRLASKWAPRKGPVAKKLAKAMKLSPKQYRKLIVGNTEVVETKMSAREWDAINFNHVPSQAGRIYRKAFSRHTPNYGAYLEALKAGSPEAKVNVATLYPYQIVSTVSGWNRYNTPSQAEITLANAQWAALPNYVGDEPVFAMVDVSGSMTAHLPKSKDRILDVAVSLGLYVADKNTGPFKDCFLTFSSDPKITMIQGKTLYDKVVSMSTAHWQMSTDLIKAFAEMLRVAKNGNVPDHEMPKTLLILSDMQFNACVRFDDSAMESIKRQYESAGYTLPRVVFWNLNAYDNVPVAHHSSGVALVSGFSPSIMKSILGGEDFTPYGIMMKTIMNDRYAV